MSREIRVCLTFAVEAPDAMPMTAIGSAFAALLADSRFDEAVAVSIHDAGLKMMDETEVRITGMAPRGET